MTYNLDLKDRKLLYELDLNSRQSFSELSKKIKLSKTALINRISNFQKEGIIKQFHTVIDTGKLGLIAFRLLLNLQNASPEKEQEIIEFLKKKDSVTWVVSIEGEYNIGALSLTKSIDEMNFLWNELLAKYGNYIEKRLLTIMTGVHYFSRAYLTGLRENKYELITLTSPKETIIDEKDGKILSLLATNSRISIVEISSKVNLTPKTVIQKIKKLEKLKIIVGYKTVFDLNKLGYQYFKMHIMLNNLNFEKKNQFKEYVKTNPNIIYLDEVLGGDDIEIEIQTKGAAELKEIINDLREQFSGIIKEYSILEYYKEHKYIFLPERNVK